MQDWVAEVIGDKGILEDNKGLGIGGASMGSWKSLRCLVDMSGHDAQVSRGLTRGEATGMVRQRRKLEANQVFSGFPPCILSSQAQGPGFGPRLQGGRGGGDRDGGTGMDGQTVRLAEVRYLKRVVSLH